MEERKKPLVSLNLSQHLELANCPKRLGQPSTFCSLSTAVCVQWSRVAVLEPQASSSWSHRERERKRERKT